MVLPFYVADNYHPVIVNFEQHKGFIMSMEYEDWASGRTRAKLVPKPTVKEGYQVECPNGRLSPIFERKDQAIHWAEWEHTCLSVAHHQVHHFEIFDECPFDGQTHKPSQCPALQARLRG